MQKIKIACTSSGGLDPMTAKALDIDIIPILIEFQGKQYREGLDLDPSAFFRQLETTAPDRYNLPKTVIPTAESTQEVVKKAISRGFTDIIFVCMSTNLGSAFNKIRVDSQPYAEQIHLHYVDTKAIGYIEAYLALRAGCMAMQHETVENILVELENIRQNSYMFGACTSLDYPIYNGRLKGAQAFWGRALRVCPSMLINEEGELVSFAKALHKAKSFELACAKLQKTLGNCENYILWRFHTGRENEKYMLRAEQKVGIAPNAPEVTMPLSTGVHTGPAMSGWGLIKLENS